MRFLGIILFIAGLSSCLNRQFIEGSAEILSVTDTTINDSTIIYGHIYKKDRESEVYYVGEYDIWIDELDLHTTNDTSGFYFFKVNPGTYTIMAQSGSNEWDILIEKIQNREFVKNTKTEIDFYIGYTVD